MVNDRQIDRQAIQIDRWMVNDRQIDRWMVNDRQIDRWMVNDRQIDRWMVNDRQIDKQIEKENQGLYRNKEEFQFFLTISYYNLT